ncbi:hypothetical protein J7E78_29180, partial [Paenibacillus polymyxa]|uniref:hypothetical protein n=1 Tax=Paenibacillus polymyxa TaxID=1406 RepID=UPI001BE8D2A4
MTSTPMEKIKAFQSMKPFVSKQNLELVAAMLNLTEVDRTIRIGGKEAEFEFLLMSHSLGNLKDIIAFEEGFSRLTNTVTTDFLFITQDDRRLVIEVKSTEKSTWKISETVLNDKEKFAELMNAELYFAIKIKNNWIFLPSNYVRQKEKRITVDDLLNTELHILGEQTFIFRKSLTFKTSYVTDASKGIGIQHPDYGFLNRYSLEINKTNILRVTPSSNNKLLGYIFPLEAVQDSASNHHQEIKKIDANKTLIIEILNENCQFNLSHFLLAPIRHITHDLHDNYDFPTYIIENIDKLDEQFINRNTVLNTLGMLHKKGLEVIEVINKNLYPLARLLNIL